MYRFCFFVYEVNLKTLLRGKALKDSRYEQERNQSSLPCEDIVEENVFIVFC